MVITNTSKFLRTKLNKRRIQNTKSIYKLIIQVMQNMLEILEKRSISVRSWDSKTYLVSKRRICSVPIEVFIFQLLYFKGLTETKINNLGLFPEGFTTT